MTRRPLPLTPETTLLTTGDVARMMRVQRQTIIDWCDKGKLSCIRTPSGHRRIRLSDVQKIMAGDGRR